MVTVVPDLGEQLRHPALGPVTAYPTEIRLIVTARITDLELGPAEIRLSRELIPKK